MLRQQDFKQVAGHQPAGHQARSTRRRQQALHQGVQDPLLGGDGKEELLDSATAGHALNLACGRQLVVYQFDRRKHPHASSAESDQQGAVLELADDVGVDVGTIIGDVRKFKQILLNLMSNAVKFTPQGGRVTLGARRFDDHIEVSVADTGVGIAPEDQGKVFEAFQQVGTDIMRKAEGTGLGLTLTRKFVELHGGKLELESEVGKGSRFYFTLPLVAKAASVQG